MKKILLIIVILTLHSVNSQSDHTKMKLNDTWFAGESKNNGKPVIIRGRQYLKNFIESKQYPELIELTWSVKNPTENGIPEPEENFEMGQIEDALIDSFESDLQSILTIVYTNNNQRTWIFYTKSVTEFGKRLNETLANFPRIPISIEKDDDPNWELYIGILKNNQLEPK